MRVTRNHSRRSTSVFGATLMLAAGLLAVPASAWQETADPAAEETPASEAPAAEAPAAEAPAAEAPAAEEKAAEPETAAAEPVVDDVRASSFQEVTPGETPAAQLAELLGEAENEQQIGDERVLSYQIGPFPKVDVIVADEVVSSIVVHLETPAAPDEVAQELGLFEFTAVSVAGVTGESLGQIYPERGVMFSFIPGAEKPLVGQLVLEPITAEPFLLRVRSDRRHRYQHNLADLAYAEKLEPDNAELHWLQAKTLAAAGRPHRALPAADKAIGLERDARFLITRSEILFELDEFERAVRDAEAVLADEAAPPQIRARAQCLAGDLIAAGPEHQYKEAIKHHLAAIQAATPLASDHRAAVRREAKQVLIDAYFAVAGDIARGKWQKKQEMMEKWLKSASELTYGILEHDQGDEELRLLVIRQTLSAYAGIKANADPKTAVAQLLDESRHLLSTTTDPLYEHRIRWQTIQTLHYAIEIAQSRRAAEQALGFAEKAVAIIERLDRGYEPTPKSKYLIGRIYFHAGLMHAVLHKDHQRAVRSYEKALSHFAGKLPSSAGHELGQHGERFVSMGVSYWQDNVRAEAVKLTRRGLSLMQEAHRQGLLDKRALAVPYGNLAAMYKELDQPEEADRMAARAAELDDDGGSSNR